MDELSFADGQNPEILFDLEINNVSVSPNGDVSGDTELQLPSILRTHLKNLKISGDF